MVYNTGYGDTFWGVYKDIEGPMRDMINIAKADSNNIYRIKCLARFTPPYK